MKNSLHKIAILFAMTLILAAYRTAIADPAVTDTADAAPLLASAQHQFGAGNYSAAIKTLSAVISENPLNAEAFYWLGRCYYEIHDLENSIAHAEKSAALQPKNSVYQDQLGRAYGAKADRDKSFFIARKVKKQFQTAVQLDPTNIAARRDLQEFCMQAPWIVGGNMDEARAQIDAIARIDSVQGHLARAAFNLEVVKKPELAESEYREVLAAKPAKADSYFEVANFFRDQNRATEMNAAVDAVSQVDPSEPRLPFYRGIATVMTGSNLERGEEYLKSYLASTPDRSDWPSHAGTREWLGQLYEKQGKRAEAAEQYRASLQLEPGRKSAQQRLAKLGKSAA